MPSEVFCLKELKQKLPYKIDSIATARNLFLIGTNDGKLIVYEVSLQKHDAQCVYVHSSKHKQPIRMIIPIVEKAILLVVTGDLIVVHQLNHMTSAHLDSLPEDRLPEMHTIKGLKDIVTLHVKRQKDIFSMAVLQRKKITIYEYRDKLKEFVIVKDGLLLPDGAKTLLWVGKNLMIGFRREYVLLNVSTGATDCLYPTGKSGVPLLLSLDPVPEVLVGEEGVGVRALLDGSLVPGKSGMPWSSHPTNAAYIYPFLLTMHDNNCIEVRLPFFDPSSSSASSFSTSKSPNPSLWQSIRLKSADRISQRPFADFDASLPAKTTPPDALRRDITIVIDSGNTVYLLELLPVKDQVSALSSENCFEAGLTLCQLCINEVDQATVNNLKTQFALWSFNTRKDFKTSMVRFRDANVDPRLVINLFPGFLTRAAQETWHPPKEYTDSSDRADFALHTPEAITAFLDYALPLRTEYATTETNILKEAIDTAIMKAYTVIGQEEQLIDFLDKENACALAGSETFLMDNDQWVALATLWRRHKQHERSLRLFYTLGTSRAEQRLSLESHLPRSKSSSSSSLPQGELPFDAEFSHILQSLLSKSFAEKKKSINDRNVVEFIPQCILTRHLAEISVDADRPHQPSLLRRCVGVVTTILYMRCLSWSDPESKVLIRQYSPWILANVSPQWSVTMFPVAEMNANDYTDLLDLISSDMSDIGGTQPHERVAEWLSLVFANKCNTCTDVSVHDAYFQSLVKCILSASDVGDAGEEKKENGGAQKFVWRQRLGDILRTSQYVDITKARTLLEKPDVRSHMYAERAIIYKRLKLHEEAIRMFLHEARELEAAQDYATHASCDGEDTFQVLLQLLLNPSDVDGCPPLSEAIAVLNTCEGVNPLTALPMLPDNTPLPAIAGFIKQSLQDVSTRSRKAAINANVLEARIRQAELTLARERSRRVVMDLGTCCAVCKKKLRPDVVFARFPNRVVVHQACVEEEHVCPVTYKDFRRGIEPVAREPL